MVARILALVVAVAMVAGAFVYRYGMPGGGGGAGGGGSEAGRVICAQELGTVCDALPGAEREPASVTAEHLIAAKSQAEADVSAWLAPGPWAAMVEEQRAQDELFDDTERLAHTNLVAVVRKGQTIPGCATPVTWTCVGDAAQDRNFRIGGDPSGQASGLFVRAAALGGLLGPDYATNDIEGEPQGWLANLDDRLAAAPGFGAPSLQQFLVITGSVRAYLTSAASAAQNNAQAAADVVVPEPVARMEATLAMVEGASVDRRRLAGALTEAGWEAGPGKGDDGLPSPGVLLALRERLQ